MINEHERAQELLAAHALHALDDEDRVELEGFVRSHVNGCLECRSAMWSFESLASDLALAAEPVKPPASLASRLRRDIRSSPEPAGVWTRSGVAASIVLVLTALALWNAHLHGLVTRAETSQQLTGEVLDTMSRPETHVVRLGPESGPVVGRVVAAYVPGRNRMYLFGSLPAPGHNLVYQIWLGHQGTYASAGTFVPEASGRVVVRIEANAEGFDAVLITEEPAAGSASPSGRHVLTASL